MYSNRNERTLYAPPIVQPGDEIPYSALGDRQNLPWYDDSKCASGNPLGFSSEPRIPCTLITLTECGDYSGNALVGESNYRMLKEMCPWLVEIYGSHGYKALAYLGKRENQSEALLEALDSLDTYPLLSEDDHSELECERESEAWSEDGERDFSKALAAYLDEIDEDHEHEITDANVAAACLPRRYYTEPIGSIWDLWREGCEAFNVNGGSGYVNEQGDSIYFYIDEWIEDARKPAYPSWSDTFKAAHESMRESILVLAHFTRIPDDDQPATQET